MLYYPWYDESSGGYATYYKEHYDHVKSTVVANENVFTSSCLDDMDVDMKSRPEHVWDELALSTKEGQHCARLEGEQSLSEMTEEDLANNARVIDPTSNSSVHVRYERAGNANEIPTA